MVKTTHHELEGDDDESQIDNKVNQTLDTEPRRRNMGFDLSKENFSKEIKAEEEDEDEEEDSVAFWKSFKRMPSLLKSDWMIVIIAICSSILLGFITSLFSILYAEIFAVSSRNI